MRTIIIRHFFPVFFLLPQLLCAQGDSVSLEKKLALASPLRQAAMLDSVGSQLIGKDPGKALFYVNREIELYQTISDKTWEGRPYCLKARIYRRLGDPDAAIALLQKALPLYEAAKNDTGIGDYHNNMGNVVITKNDYSGAIHHYNSALKIAEKLNDLNSSAAAYANIGNVYFYQAELDKAITCYEKANTFYIATGDTISSALTLDNIALVYNRQEKFEKAIGYHKSAIRVLENSGDRSLFIEALSSIGTHYADRKMNDSAAFYFHKAIAVAGNSEYVIGKVSALYNLGDLRLNEKQYGEAELYLREAMTSAAKAHMVSFSAEVSRSLSSLFEKTGKLDSALFYARLYADFQDSIHNENNTKQLNNFRTRFELERSEKAVEVANKEREKNQFRFYAAMVGAGLLVILILIVFRSSMNRKKTNSLLALQNEDIRAKNKDITDSINYARRIQSAVLPDEKILTESVKDAFIFNRPRDIVSGDFFWFARKGSLLYVAVADCTGHGVPGALVSVVGINALQQLIEQEPATDTATLLGKLHRQVITALNKDVNLRETQDGMDIALVRIALDTRTVQFSGAGRPLFYRVKNDPEIQQFHGDRMSIAGAKPFDDNTPYTRHELQTDEETTFYLFTDGIVDQFGGEKGKKFLTRRLTDTLNSISNIPLQEQHAVLEKALRDWKKDQEQTDDMLLIGFTF